ncbi:MAG: NAD-dependent [Geobacteraceae bacterium]|nr:MAG: NAD-dependent [Geobacteraceae bacterium]
MDGGTVQVVTGAFGFTGRAIARRLLARGERVRTLTGHPGRADPFGGRVEVAPYNFRDPAAMAESLRGADVLYNTYWVRFPHGEVTFEEAAANSRALLAAAAAAGVRRVVHISITNAAETSHIPYFRWKGEVERAVAESGLSHAILRPALIFGPGGIIINNIAWLLRRYPVFAVPGRGDYRLQPVFVDDLAELAVAAADMAENQGMDVIGPETFAFIDLVRLIATTVRSRARIVHVKPELALLLSRTVGALVNDLLLTRDELEGLMAGLLVSAAPPAGRTPLSRWLADNADTVGTVYYSELARHYR